MIAAAQQIMESDASPAATSRVLERTLHGRQQILDLGWPQEHVHRRALDRVLEQPDSSGWR
jgi:hypothetical protein